MNENNNLKKQSKYMMALFSIMSIFMITILLITNFGAKKTYSFTENNCPGTIYNGKCCTCSGGTTFSNGKCSSITQKAKNLTDATALAGNGYDCTVDKDSNGNTLNTYTCVLNPTPSCTTLESADTKKKCYKYACTENGWEKQSEDMTTEAECPDKTGQHWGYPPGTASNCISKDACYCYACENDKWVRKSYTITYAALCTCRSNETAFPFVAPSQIDGCKKNNELGGDSNPTTTECSVSVSTGSMITSVDADNVQNSYYTVTVSYSGSGCGSQTISYSATNAKTVSPTSYRIPSSSTSTNTVQFKVYPSSPCEKSVATAKLTNGNSDSATAVSILTDWTSHTACEKNPQYTSFEEADAAGVNYYYSNYGICADGVTQAYTKKWIRNGCGGGGGSGSDPTPTSSDPTSKSTYACYLVNHKYVWGKSKPSGGTLVNSITTESKCSGCESGYSMNSNNNCVKPSSSSSSNVPANPKTGTVGIIIAWIVGLTAIVYTLWYFKKNSLIK